jgi:hypothetical protein
LDDFTRSPANGLLHHAPNRRWLRGLLEGTLIHAGYTSRDWGPERQADQVADFMRRLGLEPSVEAWAASNLVDPLPLAAQAWLDELVRDEFVIGFELPVFLIRFLCSRNIPFLDIAIDPVRFARDLFLAARTNAQPLACRLAASEVPEDLLWADAGQMRAFLARRQPPEGTDGRIAVFFGQTNLDRTLVQNGRLLQPLAYADKIAAAAQGCDRILIRRHPCAKMPDLTTKFVSILPNATLSSENSYSLLCRHDITRVIALSSGLLTEAKYFHKPCAALAMPDVNNPALLPASCSRWHRLSISLAMPGFWAGQLPAVTPSPGLLRDSIGEKWGRTMFEPPYAVPSQLCAAIGRSIRHAFARLFPPRQGR